MARAMVYSKFLLPLFLGLVLVACKIEEAKPEISKKLVLASDFLEAKDTVLFKRFSKKMGIRLKILNLNAGQIAQKLKKEGYNSSIDLVFVKSLNSVKILDKTKFQKLNANFLREKTPSLKAFKNATWLVAGLDPFVFSYIPDSTKTAKNYSDLSTNFTWASPQSSEQFSVLLAHRGSHSKKDAKWKKGFIQNNVTFNSENDSLQNRQFLVIKHSFFTKNKELSKQREVFFPDKTYADRWCFAVVDQAKNYESAETFLVYYSSLSESTYFIKKTGVFPYRDSARKRLNLRNTILKIQEDSLLECIMQFKTDLN
jgi:ABC-type Fe3+ transport system substrate-binding protein